MKKRCFLALKIPKIEIYHDRLLQLKSDLDVRLSITNPNNYHFTLYFFGQITKDKIDQIHQKLVNLPFHKINLTLEVSGSFPSNRLSHTRVLFIQPSHFDNSIFNLVSSLRHIISEMGFQVDSRPYHPHLTIGRVRSGKDVKKLTKLWLDQNFNPVELSFDTLHFYESNLSSSGSKYHSMYNYPL